MIVDRATARVNAGALKTGVVAALRGMVDRYMAAISFSLIHPTRTALRAYYRIVINTSDCMELKLYRAQFIVEIADGECRVVAFKVVKSSEKCLRENAAWSSFS